MLVQNGSYQLDNTCIQYLGDPIVLNLLDPWLQTKERRNMSHAVGMVADPINTK